MNTQDNLPFVAVKRKNIQVLLDYCLENRIEFTVAPKNSEEFKVVFNLKDFNTAISLGICLRELKIDFGTAAEAASVAAIKAKKPTNGNVKETTSNEKTVAIEPLTIAPDNSLSFDLDAMN